MRFDLEDVLPFAACIVIALVFVLNFTHVTIYTVDETAMAEQAQIKSLQGQLTEKNSQISKLEKMQPQDNTIYYAGFGFLAFFVLAVLGYSYLDNQNNYKIKQLEIQERELALKEKAGKK